MKVVLSPDDHLIVEFADTDGTFSIFYDSDDITVFADLPDSKNRSGIIYQERFGEIPIDSD